MALIVQKFGGSSVADIDRIRNVANRVVEYRHRGDQVVVVVSAMKGVTDNLIDMAKSLMPVPSEREMDMLLATGEQTTIALLAIALQSMDIPAASLTGAQAGIVTDGVHSKAKIRNITPKKIHAMLDAGNVTIDGPPGLQVLQLFADLFLEYDVAFPIRDLPSFWAAVKRDEIMTFLAADWFVGFLRNNVPEQAGLWRAMPIPACSTRNSAT